jgi:hypothetical protein
MLEEYYGCKCPANFKYIHPNKQTVKFYLLDHQIVQLKVVEDPNGEYYGWIDNGEDHIKLIQPNIVLFKIQFPGNPDEDKKGRVVRLTITEIEEKDDDLSDTSGV